MKARIIEILAAHTCHQSLSLILFWIIGTEAAHKNPANAKIPDQNTNGLPSKTA
jgi:hypothetical protein